MNKIKATAWSLGILLATSGALVAVASGPDEPQPSYRSSVQVDRKNEAASELVKFARITTEDAMRRAGAATAGRVIGAELENEVGNLVYSVEITGAGGVTEVIVDAGDGRILSSSTEAEEDENEEDENGEDENENEEGNQKN